jgi:hypothetical protein
MANCRIVKLLNWFYGTLQYEPHLKGVEAKKQ